MKKSAVIISIIAISAIIAITLAVSRMGSNQLRTGVPIENVETGIAADQECLQLCEESCSDFDGLEHQHCIGECDSLCSQNF